MTSKSIYSITNPQKCKEYIPYTYLIGWSSHNIWYYGVEYKNSAHGIANPSNLWVEYFTSSVHVAKFRVQYGEPNIVQVRKSFKTSKDAYAWEAKVLRRMKAIKSPNWLNKHNNFGEFVSSPGTDDYKKKSMEKYGYQNPMQNEYVKEKRKQTNIEIYGTSCSAQNPDISDKISKTQRTKSTGHMYLFTDPEMKIFEHKSITAVCRKFRLFKSCMWYVVNCKQKQHKNYMAIEIVGDYSLLPQYTFVFYENSELW